MKILNFVKVLGLIKKSSQPPAKMVMQIVLSIEVIIRSMTRFYSVSFSKYFFCKLQHGSATSQSYVAISVMICVWIKFYDDCPGAFWCLFICTFLYEFESWHFFIFKVVLF